MGIIKQGILGGFSGKVGNVVGASWKGIDYIRSLPSSVRNPRTPRQVKQRTKFSLVQGFLTSMTPFIRIGFRNYTNQQSAMNAALSYNVTRGIKGEGENIELDYPNLQVSRGKLFSTTVALASVNGDNITVEWETIIANDAREKDEVYVVFFNKSKGVAIYNSERVYRMAGETRFAIPALWDGDTVECYVAFSALEGKEMSNSKYAGSIEIPTA